MATLRTRFAPSPTGFLHIGGARTALYNWAYTRRLGGSFVLRIEDTDRERSTAESEAAVLGGLEWLGIDWDEGPFRQSERAELYAAAIERLLAQDRAYRCVCTPDEIEARRQAVVATGGKWTYDGRCAEANHGPACGPHAVRLRVPREGKLGFDDGVFGPSGQEARELGDMVIRRTDGTPLYHLAGVVDDVAMGITHVIRGADHLNNTPFQLALYRALDATPPQFAHVPLIVGTDGRKLSKRRDPVSVQHFRDAGYLPDAMLNWLVRIGWSHGDQEIFSRDEIRALFDLSEVHRSSGQADPGKLDWLNQHYIKERPRDALVRELLPFLAAAGTPVEPSESLGFLVDLLRERSKTLVEMAERARFFAVADDAIAYDADAVRKHWKPAALAALKDLADELARCERWDLASIEAAFSNVLGRHEGLALGKLAQPVRIAVTGSAASPGIFETVFVLGRERARARIERALGALSAA
ncbi:MAG: glutamate--tRNA ligase [Proteobacteria bacterium]|nr:MAG: glutamate--tRNA ligase [Pseudomonadota bacterium]